MANFFDQFDETPTAGAQAPASGNFFDQFDDEMAAAPEAAPVAAAPAFDPKNSWGDWALDVAGGAAEGLRSGVSNMVGLPVEIANNLPKIINLLPGEQGVGTVTEIGAALNNYLFGDGNFAVPEGVDTTPVGGAASIDKGLRFGGAIDPYNPETVSGRYAERIGEEIGAAATGIGLAGTAVRTLGREGVRALGQTGGGVRQALGGTARTLLEPMAAAPGKVVARELGYSTAAGAGAQFANELVSDDGEGTWWSDLLGSIGGATAAGLSGAGLDLVQAGRAAVKGDTSLSDDIAGAVVADRLLGSSSVAQQNYERFGDIDASPLIYRLRQQSAAEEAFPGFRANIADRAEDPGLSNLAYNVDATQGGSAALRRNNNARVVDDRMIDLAPDGNATALRQSLQTGADARIADAQSAEAAARAAFDVDQSQLVPEIPSAERGGMLRGALEARRAQEDEAIAGLYGQLDQSVPVDAAEYRRRVEAFEEGLPLNDRDRFLPSEVRTARALAPEDGPVPTGVLDAGGRPIMRDPGSAEQKLSEILAIRSGLSSDMRSLATTDQQRHVLGSILDETERFIMDAAPDQADIARQAREARLDVAKRFEDTGAVPDILNKSGRKQYTMTPEAVPGRAMRSETDYKAVMAEAGDNPDARRAIADQLRDEATTADVLNSPARMAKFLNNRNVVLADHPEIRTALEKAGASKSVLDKASLEAKKIAKDYSPGGRTATGQYLKYDDTGTRDAIKTAWNAPSPEAAMKNLLETAGDTPDTRAAMRAALWEEVKGSGKLKATTSTPSDGVQRWSGTNLAERISDPKFSRAMEIAWEDAPEHLADIRKAAEALRRSEGSLNAKTPATSGSAQALGGKFDRSISTTGIASRIRSVHRGQLSPTIAVVDVMSTALRNRSAKVQAKAIEEMMAEAVNNPEFAAALLAKYNPADAAGNRLFLSKYGVRIPTVANIIASEDEDDFGRVFEPSSTERGK